MKTKRFNGKLVLNKNTIVNFKSLEMGRIKGGGDETTTCLTQVYTCACDTYIITCFDTGVLCNTKIALCNTNSPACPW